MKSLTLLTLLSVLLASCSGTSQEIPTNTKKLSLKEASAVAVSKASPYIWVAEDSGNKNRIYGLDADGKIAHTVTVTNAPNVDWEDLATDEEGNVYIGDFGNNDNVRKDLSIYKVNAADLKNEKAVSPAKITFYYPEQQQFPPKKSELFYDAESFFFYKGNFYLFTKNRSKGFDGTVLLYKVPNQAGHHKAQLLGKFKACDSYHKCAITSADISPDGKKVVLLSASKVWLLSGFTADNFLGGTTQMFELNDVTQKEGVCFKDNETLLVVDEKSKKTGGNLYEIKLADLKSKS